MATTSIPDAPQTTSKEEAYNKFEMQPKQQNTFQGNIIKDIINLVLQETLSGNLRNDIQMLKSYHRFR